MRTFLKFLAVLFVISVPLEIAALFFPLSRDIPAGSWEGGFYTVSLKCGSLMSPKTLTVANDAEAQDTLKSDMKFLQNNDVRVPRGVNIDTYVPTGPGISGYVSPAQQVQQDKATCAESRAKVKQFMLWVSPIGLIGCILIVILVVGVVGFALGGGGGGGGITIRGSARPALGGRGWWIFHFWRS